MPFSVPRLSTLLIGNLILRIASAASGALIGFYLAVLVERGDLADVALVGVLGIVVYGAELVGAIPFGLLADRFSARIVLVMSAVLGAVAVQLFGITGLVLVFFISRSLEGLSASAVNPALLSYLSALTSSNLEMRGRVMSWFEVTLFGGLAFGTLVAGVLWDRIHEAAFSAIALLYVIVAVLFWLGADNTVRDDNAASHNPLATLRSVFSDVSLQRLAPSWIIANAVASMWLLYTPTLLTLNEDAASGQYLVGLMSAQQVGIAGLIYSILFATGVVWWGGGMDRRGWGKVWVMKVGTYGILGVCLWFYLLNSSAGWSPIARWGIVAIYAVFIMIQAGITPAALAYLADASDETLGRGATMGVYTVLLGLGGIVGGAIGSLVVGDYFLNGMLVGTVVLCVIALISLQFVPESKVG